MSALSSSHLSRSWRRPEQSLVLVIGGAGYIGSALLAKLLAEGRRVRVMDLLLYGTGPIKDLLGHPNLEVIQADLRGIHFLVNAMQGVDEIVHLAGIVGHDPACAIHEDLTIDMNVAAMRNLAEIAKGANVRKFVFASTCSVYGTSNEVFNERSVLNPVSLYARAKLASERVLLSVTDENFQPIILRFPAIYGVSGRMRLDLAVNLLTAKAVLEGEIPVHGGSQWRPFLHVEDAADAVLLALRQQLHSEFLDSQVFNVGSNDQNYQIRQISELVRRCVPDSKLVVLSDAEDEGDCRVQFSKFKRMFRFRPRWTLEHGIKQVREFVTTHRHFMLDAVLAGNSGNVGLSAGLKSGEPSMLHPGSAVYEMPPLGAQRLLYFVLPRKNRQDIIGDLAEEYKTEILPRLGRRGAVVWYWSQAIRSVAPVVYRALVKSSVLAGVAKFLSWLWRKLM